MFDPTIFGFKLVCPTGIEEDLGMWVTDDPTKLPYDISYNDKHKWYEIRERYIHNGENRYIRHYLGRIPDNDFAFQLMKNLELDLTIIQRDNKINSLDD